MVNSHAGAPGTPFCIVGGHIVDPATSWKLVRCNFRDGEWIPNPKSPASIVCCATHLPEELCQEDKQLK
jgi:hypothetical protein